MSDEYEPPSLRKTPDETVSAQSSPGSHSTKSAPSYVSPYGQPNYGPTYPAQGYVATTTNTMAILSLIFAFIVPVLGIVFGIIARKQLAQRPEGGDGLAKAGLIVGIVFTALGALYIIFILAAVLIPALASV